MLHLAQKVVGAPVSGTDGDIGTLEDFYFEEGDWTVKYLLVDTGSWLNGKRLLVSPVSVQSDWGVNGLQLNLTKDEVSASPEVDETVPQPRQSRLDSINEITGYHIHARDGEIGHVDDFLIGQDSWRIRYVVVDTSNWLGGRAVIVSSDTLERVDQDGNEVFVAADRKTIAHAPELESISAALSLAENGPPFTFI